METKNSEVFRKSPRQVADCSLLYRMAVLFVVYWRQSHGFLLI